MQTFLYIQLLFLCWVFTNAQLECLKNASFKIQHIKWSLAGKTNIKNEPYSIFKHGQVPSSSFSISLSEADYFKISFYCQHDIGYILRMNSEVYKYDGQNMLTLLNGDSETQCQRISKIKIIGTDCENFITFASNFGKDYHVWALKKFSNSEKFINDCDIFENGLQIEEINLETFVTQETTKLYKIKDKSGQNTTCFKYCRLLHTKHFYQKMTQSCDEIKDVEEVDKSNILIIILAAFLVISQTVFVCYYEVLLRLFI